MCQLMWMQKEGDCYFNICLVFVLVLMVMEFVLNQVIKFVSVKGVDINVGIINLVKDFVMVIVEFCFDDVSQFIFYFIVVKGSDIVEVVYFNGVDELYIDQQEGFMVDGVIMKVCIDVGVVLVDYCGMVKCIV